MFLREFKTISPNIWCGTYEIYVFRRAIYSRSPSSPPGAFCEDHPIAMELYLILQQHPLLPFIFFRPHRRGKRALGNVSISEYTRERGGNNVIKSIDYFLPCSKLLLCWKRSLALCLSSRIFTIMPESECQRWWRERRRKVFPPHKNSQKLWDGRAQ